MNLNAYLNMRNQGIDVIDDVYDCAWYAYPYEYGNKDAFDEAVDLINRHLTVTVLRNDTVTVNMSELVEDHLDELRSEGLFNLTTTEDIEDIMENIPSIMSGYVSEEWMQTFAEILTHRR